VGGPIGHMLRGGDDVGPVGLVDDEDAHEGDSSGTGGKR
jgi:hypothetical protein